MAGGTTVELRGWRIPRGPFGVDKWFRKRIPKQAKSEFRSTHFVAE